MRPKRSVSYVAPLPAIPPPLGPATSYSKNKRQNICRGRDFLYFYGSGQNKTGARKHKQNTTNNIKRNRGIGQGHLPSLNLRRTEARSTYLGSGQKKTAQRTKNKNATTINRGTGQGHVSTLDLQKKRVSYTSGKRIEKKKKSEKTTRKEEYTYIEGLISDTIRHPTVQMREFHMLTTTAMYDNEYPPLPPTASLLQVLPREEGGDDQTPIHYFTSITPLVRLLCATTCDKHRVWPVLQRIICTHVPGYL